MGGLKSAADLERVRGKIIANTRDKKIVSVTNGTDGRTRGSQKVMDALSEELQRQGLSEKIILKSTGCQGFCEKEPIILILPEEICYVEVKPKDVPQIVYETLVQGKIIERLLHREPNRKRPIVKESDIPFYKPQARIVLGNNRFLDMGSIDDYIALGGYSALAKVLFEMTSGVVCSPKTGPD